jgi:hypothetical protein
MKKASITLVLMAAVTHVATAQTCQLSYEAPVVMNACCPPPPVNEEGHRRTQARTCQLPRVCPLASCAAAFHAFFTRCERALRTDTSQNFASFRAFEAQCQAHFGSGGTRKKVCVCSHGTATTQKCPRHGLELCASCDAGYSVRRHGSSMVCDRCPAGTFSKAGATSCSPCARGTADLDSNPATPCHKCGKGTFSAPHQVLCTLCPPGTHDIDSDPATPCVTTVCTCKHGTPTSGLSCALNGSAKCQSCSPGFSINPAKTACLVNKCKCAHGTPRTGPGCTRNGAAMCQTCQQGFRMSSAKPSSPKTCATNVCHCPNGVPTTGAACKKDGTITCIRCKAGYSLDTTKRCRKVAGASVPTQPRTNTILYQEKGAADGTGWSNKEVTNVGSAGKVHGPWGNDAKRVSKQIPIARGVAECTVSWRSWAIDSRDNEADRVIIDGKEVWQKVAHTPCRNGWSQGPKDFPNPWQGQKQNQVCYVDVKVDVPCSKTLTITFESDIDQAERDE